MYLITSAAYVDQELASEFGQIPPSFLPVKNKRLYELQRALIPPSEKCFLSLPKDFFVEEQDRSNLEKLNISIIRLDTGLSLGESICASLKSIPEESNSLNILHGDTLFDAIPDIDALDFVSISQPDDYYRWDSLENSNSEDYKVISGFFSISNAEKLCELINEENHDFIAGLEKYAKTTKLAKVAFDNWLDFGHITTYFRSKAKLTTQRSFNDMSISAQKVTKSSQFHKKIEAEYSWFTNIPSELKIYTPQAFNFKKEKNQSEYSMEYLYLSTLNELYVFGQQPIYVWEKILMSCSEFLSECKKTKADELSGESVLQFYESKTISRYEDFLTQRNFEERREHSINNKKVPPLRTIIESCLKKISVPQDEMLAVVHGDFCFSNILYDFRAKRIKVIDPRGIDPSGTNSVFGDVRYDIAKLSHSVIGMYDFIISNRYDLATSNNAITLSFPASRHISNIQELFKKQSLAGINPDQPTIKALTILLFISMLPLHHDNSRRQLALLYNAMRLYSELDT